MKKKIRMLVLCGALLLAGLVLHHLDLQLPCLIVCAAGYLLAGHKVLWKAARGIVRGSVFDENFLMAIATIGAFAIGEYPEGAAVMLFYEIGELFEHMAVNRSRSSIKDLMQICPDIARRKTDNGTETVDPADVRIGEIVLVSPGERIPLDGTVVKGLAQIDTSALTGESAPRFVQAGDAVQSGCICLDSVLEIRADKPFEQSTASKILELVENASAKKSRSEAFITRFAAWYTPIVVVLAVLLAVVPPLALHASWHDWIYRALNFLVVSCPCALVISVPLSFFGGIGAASRNGILVKGSVYMEALAKADTIVYDKTGTLTEGVFAVTDCLPQGITAKQLLQLAAGAERYSSHPIAVSLRGACPDLPAESDVTDVQEYAGKGVGATVCGKAVLVGNAAMMRDAGLNPASVQESGTLVHVAANGVYCGCIRIADRIKSGTPAALQKLRESGVRQIMLSGDRKQTAESVGKALKLDAVHAELLPADKVEQLEAILHPQGTTVYVGDGINDAPVLARADVGVAMGALGSDAAIEAADVVLMHDDLNALHTVLALSRRTMQIVRQNILFALAVKIGVLTTSALGWTGLWLAVFADVGVCVLAILNALRTMRKEK